MLESSDRIDAVRKDQTQEYRRRASSTGSPTSGQKKFVAKGHDAILDRIQREGRIVGIEMISGGRLYGKITKRDRYTITINADGETTTIFKHAIAAFWAKA